MSYYLKVLKNYVGFSGRARRSEYWYFFLFNCIIVTVLSYLQPIGSIYSFAVLIPSVAVGIRRMHDVDRSGWFILIPIYNIILACTEGTKDTNRFGVDSKLDKVI